AHFSSAKNIVGDTEDTGVLARHENCAVGYDGTNAGEHSSVAVGGLEGGAFINFGPAGVGIDAGRLHGSGSDSDIAGAGDIGAETGNRDESFAIENQRAVIDNLAAGIERAAAAAGSNLNRAGIDDRSAGYVLLPARISVPEPSFVGVPAPVIAPGTVRVPVRLKSSPPLSSMLPVPIVPLPPPTPIWSKPLLMVVKPE